MDKLKTKTTSYKVTEVECTKRLVVDIVRLPDVYEAWIYIDDNDKKTFMFGVSRKDMSEAQFVDLVESNLRGKNKWQIVRQYLTS